jgi:integrase
VTTFGSVWNLVGPEGKESPTGKLQYPKSRPPKQFFTRAEIEERVARGGLSDEQVKELWAGLFLDRVQINECLEHVKKAANCPPFVYPMFVFVGHTGARRSEMMRSRVEDFDFASRTVRIREKKKDTDVEETYRRLKMSPLLTEVMRAWLANHPGGEHTFCLSGVVQRSSKRSLTTGHQNPKARATGLKARAATVRPREVIPGPQGLTRKEADSYFEKALAGSKWEVIKGFHTFRHSVGSIMAAAGVPERTIKEMLGHLTDDMLEHYRHLYPHETRDVIDRVFG